MINVWLKSQSRLMDEALANLLESDDIHVTTGPHQPDECTLAIWDLRGSRPPHPKPPALPTLAFVDDHTPTKIAVLALGYRGYLNGDETLDELRRAFDVIERGELWAERSVLSRVVQGTRAPTFTPREHEVLALVTRGLTNKQIAQRLDIAEKTVKVYVSALLDKLDAKSRMELVTNHRDDT